MRIARDVPIRSGHGCLPARAVTPLLSFVNQNEPYDGRGARVKRASGVEGPSGRSDGSPDARPLADRRPSQSPSLTGVRGEVPALAQGWAKPQVRPIARTRR